MNVQKLQETLELTPLVMAKPLRHVSGGYAGDLLSRVMSHAVEGDAWITIINHMNVIAVATLTGVSTVIFAEGVQPDSATVQAAKDREVNLLTSKESSFSLCAKLSRLL